MQKLKLPEYAARIERDKIYCLIRKKLMVLTPEEWVRQHFINLLINHLGYPGGMIRLEQSLKYFKNAKRTDITVLNREGFVFLIVECKSFKEPLNQKVIHQVTTYNKVLESGYISITNGMTHFLWKKISDLKYQQIRTFPKYEK